MLAGFDQDEMSLFQLEEKPETKIKVQLKEIEETRKKGFVKRTEWDWASLAKKERWKWKAQLDDW